MKGKRFLSLLLCFVMVLGLLPTLAVPVLAAFPDTVELDVDCYCDPGGAANRKGKPFPVDDISISAGELSNSTAANGTKTSTSLLAGIPKGTAATITITLPKEYRVAKCYFHTLAGRSTSTSTFTEKKLLKYQNTTFQYNLEQQVQGDNRIATLTFTVSDSSFTDPNDALLKAITQKLVSYFEIEQATTKVTFYPVPGDNSKKIEKTLADGQTTVAAPTIEEITAAYPTTADYFSIMEPEKWYIDGVTAPQNEWTPETVITQSTSVYASNKLKDDATIKAIAYLPMRKPIQYTNQNGVISNWCYTPTGNAEALAYPSQDAQYWNIPVGKALTAADIPGMGQYDTLVKNKANTDFSSGKAEVTAWRYRDKTSTWQELSVGGMISEETAVNLALANKSLTIYADTTFHNSISFDTKVPALTIGPLTVDTKESMGGSSGNTVTSEEAKNVADKISEKERESDFDQLFRGWYPNADYKGLAIDLPTHGFNSDAKLYAKWVETCTVKFDFGRVTPTNNALYTDLKVGKGDLLDKPERPLAGGMAFDGWYKDAGFAQPWTFEETYVSDGYGGVKTDEFGSPIVDKPGDHVTEKTTTLYAKFTGATPITVNFKYYGPDNVSSAETKHTYSDVPVASNYPYGALPELPGNAKTEQVIIAGIPTMVTSYVEVGTKRTHTYTGWEFTDKNGQKHDLTPETVLYDYLSEGQTTLDVYAKHDTTFTIKFDLDGGTMTNMPADKVIKGESGTVDEPTEKPTKENWAFGGWINAATNADFVFTNPCTENTIIKAKWVTPKQYTVMFQLEPATASFTITKQNNDTVIPPESSENGKVTYKLTSGTYTWTASAEGYMTIQQTLTVPEDYDETYVNPIKLTPFQAVTYIELNIPENKIMQKKSYDLGNLATVKPETAPNKTIKWSVKAANDGVTLGEDGTLTVSDTAVVGSTVTLTATIAEGALSSDGTEKADYKKDFTLTITKYLATISFEHGTGDHPNVELPKPKSVNDNGTLTEPTVPSASGWTFDGWYKNEACGDDQLWNFEKDTAQEDRTLYAKWTKNPVDVTITFAGGEGATLNTNMSSTHNGKSGDKITLPPCMYTKSGYIFRSWGGTFAGTEYTLPEEAATFTASWTQVSAAISEDDITHALDGLTKDNTKNYKPQLLAVRDALAAGTATKTNAALIAKLSELFADAGLGPAEIAGDAKDGVSEVGAILSSDGAKVVLTVNKQATPGKTLPEAYQNAEYKSAWYSLSMTVGGTTTEPKVPVILTMPIPAALSEMAADTIRVLLYKGAATEPVVMTPTVSGSNLTFAYDGNGQLAFVGKSISDAADTRVTALVMKYNGTTMGNVNPQGVIEPDENGNFTVLLPSTTSESTLQDLASGINSKWVTYMTVAPKATVKPSDGGAQNAEYWAKTGLTLTYSLTNSNKYSDSKTFTVTAENGTTRNFTVTVKKITSEDRTYKIAVANISGGTVTATPSPAAAGEEVKLTVTPNDGKKLVAGSLSYCLQSAGAKSVPIDESSLTFIMPAGDININAQFEDDANAPLKNPPQITAFMINGVSAVINSDTKAITIILPYGTDLKHVAPTIVTANASKVVPSSAQRVDLSTPKAYRVYASNGAYVTYTVTAYTEEPSPTQSLWEKLQNQINSNPNWWELAEYQKKTGYYK